MNERRAVGRRETPGRGSRSVRGTLIPAVSDDRSVGPLGQAVGGRVGVVKLHKGTGGMPRRHQNSGVEGCEKSGGAAQRASIPECPRNPGN